MHSVNRNMLMNTLHQTYTASDITAFYLIHKLWTFLSKRNDCDPNYFDMKIDIISGGWRNYKVATGLSAIDIEMEIEFTLIRYEGSGASRNRRYWGLAEDGLRLKLKIGGGYRDLLFRTLEDGTLYPAPESVESVIQTQQLWKEAVA
jgi:hypothetical protein